MNDKQDKICGNCRFHKFIPLSNEWECSCEASEYYPFVTGYSDKCEDWEEKGGLLKNVAEWNEAIEKRGYVN